MKMATMTPCLAPLPVILLAMAGCGEEHASDRLNPLIRQLQGDGCAYSAEPVSAKPEQSCAPREGSTRLVAWLFSSKQECVRDAAVCLAGMGPGAKAAAPAMIEAIRNGPNNYDTGDGTVMVRDAMVEALGKTGDARALPVLIEVLEHPKPMDSGEGATGEASKHPIGETAALRALGTLGPAASAAIPRIVPHLRRPGSSPYDTQVMEAAATALGSIGSTAAIPALTEALASGPAAHRAAEALGRFGPAAREALPPLVRLIEEAPDRDGEMLIRQAIADIGGRAAADRLPKAYQAMMQEIWRLARETAKSKGLRLGAVHLNSPKEEITFTLPGRRSLSIFFSKDAWRARRAAEGTVTIRRGEDDSSREAYAGNKQLERVIDRALDGALVR